MSYRDFLRCFRFDFDTGSHAPHMVAIGFSLVLALPFDSGNLTEKSRRPTFQVVEGKKRGSLTRELGCSLTGPRGIALNTFLLWWWDLLQ